MTGSLPRQPRWQLSLVEHGTQLMHTRAPPVFASSGHGLELWVSPFGATITRLLVSDKDGKMEGDHQQRLIPYSQRCLALP